MLKRSAPLVLFVNGDYTVGFAPVLRQLLLLGTYVVFLDEFRTSKFCFHCYSELTVVKGEKAAAVCVDCAKTDDAKKRFTKTALEEAEKAQQSPGMRVDPDRVAQIRSRRDALYARRSEFAGAPDLLKAEIIKLLNDLQPHAVGPHPRALPPGARTFADDVPNAEPDPVAHAEPQPNPFAHAVAHAVAHAAAHPSGDSTFAEAWLHAFSEAFADFPVEPTADDNAGAKPDPDPDAPFLDEPGYGQKGHSSRSLLHSLATSTALPVDGRLDVVKSALQFRKSVPLFRESTSNLWRRLDRNLARSRCSACPTVGKRCEACLLRSRLNRAGNCTMCHASGSTKRILVVPQTRDLWRVKKCDTTTCPQFGHVHRDYNACQNAARIVVHAFRQLTRPYPLGQVDVEATHSKSKERVLWKGPKGGGLCGEEKATKTPSSTGSGGVAGTKPRPSTSRRRASPATSSTTSTTTTTSTTSTTSATTTTTTSKSWSESPAPATFQPPQVDVKDDAPPSSPRRRAKSKSSKTNSAEMPTHVSTALLASYSDSVSDPVPDPVPESQSQSQSQSKNGLVSSDPSRASVGKSPPAAKRLRPQVLGALPAPAPRAPAPAAAASPSIHPPPMPFPAMPSTVPSLNGFSPDDFAIVFPFLLLRIVEHHIDFDQFPDVDSALREIDICADGFSSLSECRRRGWSAFPNSPHSNPLSF